MGKKIDLTGQRFGELAVIKDSGERSNSGEVKWECLCDCGKIVNITGKVLKNGKTKNCGCFLESKNIADLKGQRFGKLQVIENNGKRSSNGSVIWKCKCDCGNVKAISSQNLRSGGTISCGCHKYNFIDLTGKKFGRLTVIKRVGTSEYGQPMWECQCDCGNTTETASQSLRNGVTKSCGCFARENSSKRYKKIIKDTHKKYIENELKEGTSLCKLNDKMLKNNTSGVKGVTKDKARNKWIAQLVFKGDYHYLGRFNTIEEAAKARKKAEEKYFNPILEKYGRLDESNTKEVLND